MAAEVAEILSRETSSQDALHGLGTSGQRRRFLRSEPDVPTRSEKTEGLILDPLVASGARNNGYLPPVCGQNCRFCRYVYWQRSSPEQLFLFQKVTYSAEVRQSAVPERKKRVVISGQTAELLRFPPAP